MFACFPSTPTSLGHFRVRVSSLFFDNPRKQDSDVEEDAKLMVQANLNAAADQHAMLKDNWLRGRAVAFAALGTLPRMGEVCGSFRLLDPGIVKAIIAVVHKAGPARDTEYFANEAAGGPPDYRVFPAYPELAQSNGPPSSTLPSQNNYEGRWCFSVFGGARTVLCASV